MTQLLLGKVSEIIDQYIVALNIGKENGVTKGMKFNILTPKVIIKDPDTKKVLGEFDYIKARVEVITVYDKFCLARSYEEISISPLPFPSFILPKTTRKKLPVDSFILNEKIEIGDPIRQILKES